MATYKSGKGQRGGEYRKRDTWSGTRDFNKPGSSSPGQRRSNSPWRNKPEHNKPEHNKEPRHKTYANYLYGEWKKVEQDLAKDPRTTGTVEYVEKTPTDVKDEQLCDIELHLKNREEKLPATPG